MKSVRCLSTKRWNQETYSCGKISQGNSIKSKAPPGSAKKHIYHHLTEEIRAIGSLSAMLDSQAPRIMVIYIALRNEGNSVM